MPCRYDPSEQELKEMREQETKRLVAPYIKKLDELTRLLCKVCSSLDENSEVFWRLDDSPTEVGRWWLKHQKLDNDRKKIEDEKKRLKKVEKDALAKLTKEEKEVLGLFK